MHLSSQIAFGMIVSGGYRHKRESGDTLGLYTHGSSSGEHSFGRKEQT